MAPYQNEIHDSDAPRVAWGASDSQAQLVQAPSEPTRHEPEYAGTYTGNVSFFDQIITNAALSTDDNIKMVGLPAWHLPMGTNSTNLILTPLQASIFRGEVWLYPGSLASSHSFASASWSTALPSYKPTAYESALIKSRPSWADPPASVIKTRGPVFNKLDDSVEPAVERRSITGQYALADELPQNPAGRTGFSGRGDLGRWGPNHAVVVVVTRWAKNSDGKFFYRNDQPVLECILVYRKDDGKLALPGGFILPGEDIAHAAQRTTAEKALGGFETSSTSADVVNASISAIFGGSGSDKVVAKGIVDDKRNTDNAWIEAVCLNYHFDGNTALSDVKLVAGPATNSAQWVHIHNGLVMHASHLDFIAKVAAKRGAFFGDQALSSPKSTSSLLQGQVQPKAEPGKLNLDKFKATESAPSERRTSQAALEAAQLAKANVVYKAESSKASFDAAGPTASESRRQSSFTA